MAALDIPGVGEPVGQVIRRVMTFGGAAESPTVSIGSGTGVTALFNINEPNVFVQSIEPQVIIITSTSATANLLIGDEVDSDGYWTDTLLVVGSTSAVFNNMATTVGYAAGKLYTVTDTIDLVKNTAVASVGKVKLRITYWRNADTNLNVATSS
jgi:hypothetical protein